MLFVCISNASSVKIAADTYICNFLEGVSAMVLTIELLLINLSISNGSKTTSNDSLELLQMIISVVVEGA
jgi:hypothetical protein